MLQIQKPLEKCHELLANKEIVLCLIPSHIGIQGNEMVDQQAKTSLSLEPASIKIPFSKFKPSVNKYILDRVCSYVLGKGLTSWLSFVVSNCEFVPFPLVSWVRCGT